MQTAESGAPETQAAMTIERAKEIVGEMSRACISGMGIPGMGSTNREFLMGLSLAQMVEANAIVNRWNDRPSENGRKSIQTVCDDRATAGLYALLHFKADRPGECEPTMSVEIAGKLHHLCLVYTDKPADEDEEEDRNAG